MSSTGRRGRSEESGSTARRRRSRSPLRAVSKKSKSLLGSFTSNKSKSKKNIAPDLSLEDAPAPPKIVETVTKPAPIAEEDETVYGVVLDKNAAVPPTPPRDNRAEATALQVVLLLMDPKTRRFELLQLEFDSNKAVVADVLSQISLSATEESLRTQPYNGVADRSGTLRKSDVLLSTFCQANDVILALPEGMKASECAKLARPILGDPKVSTMLSPESAPAKPLSPVKEEPRAAPVVAKKAPPAKSSGPGIMALLLPIIIAAVLYKLNAVVTAPLAPGDVLAPGLFRSKCGLLSIVPDSITGCEPALLKMGDDGVLSLYKGNDLVWEMKGSVCTEGDESCVAGAKLAADGKVTIGGYRVKVTGNRSAVNTPWPFNLEA